MQLFKIATLVAAPLVALSGCSASVAGEVDGAAVDTLFSALFTEDEDDLGEDTLTSVGGVGLSVLDGCNGMAKRQENLNALQETLNEDLEDAAGDIDAITDALDAFANGVVEYDEKNLPTDFWLVSIGASALDAGDIDGGDAKVDVKDPDLDADVFGGVTVCRINDHPSVGEDDNDLPTVEFDQDCYGALEADIEFVKYESETAFEAKATALLANTEDFAEEDPDDVGEVEISISAGHCAPLQAALEDAEEIAEEAAGG